MARSARTAGIKDLISKEKLILEYTRREVKSYYCQIEGKRTKSRRMLNQARKLLRENVKFMNSIDTDTKGFYAVTDLPADHKGVEEYGLLQKPRG